MHRRVLHVKPLVKKAYPKHMIHFAGAFDLSFVIETTLRLQYCHRPRSAFSVEASKMGTPPSLIVNASEGRAA